MRDVRLRCGCLTFCFIVGLVSSAAGSEGSVQGKKSPWQVPSSDFECRWTDMPIKIDGKADEEAWKHAQVIDNFYLPWLGRRHAPAKTDDQGEAALGPRIPLFLRRHGGHRPLCRRQGARRHDLGQRRLRAVLQAGRRQAGLLRVPGQRRRHDHGHVLAAARRGRLSALHQGRRVSHRRQGASARHAQQVAATRTRAGRSRDEFPGPTFCAPAAGPQSARAGSSPCAVTTIPSISRGRSCPPAPR